MGFVVHESHVLCVLTNGVALLTANHSSPVHSLSDPEERCRGTVLSFVSFSLVSLHVHFTDTLSLFVIFFSCTCPLNRCSKEFHCQVGNQNHSGPCVEVFSKQVSVQLHGEFVFVLI